MIIKTVRVRQQDSLLTATTGSVVKRFVDAGCTCLTFIQCVLSNGFSKLFPNDNQDGLGETAG